MNTIIFNKISQQSINQSKTLNIKQQQANQKLYNAIQKFYKSQSQSKFRVEGQQQRPPLVLSQFVGLMIRFLIIWTRCRIIISYSLFQYVSINMPTIENKVFAQTKDHQRYRIGMRVLKLSINKNIQFCTKIVWKRNDKKIQTKFQTHFNGQSCFDEPLQLDFDLIYNQQLGGFQSKETQIIVIVFYEGNIKSGGTAKIDIARLINEKIQDLDEQLNFSLTKCPDPMANLSVRFNYKLICESQQDNFKKLKSQLTTDQQVLSIIKFKSERLIPEGCNILKGKSMSLFQKYEQPQIRQEKRTFLRINSLNLNDNILNSSQSLSKIIYQQNSFCHQQNMSQFDLPKSKVTGHLPIESEAQLLKKQLDQLSGKYQELHRTVIDLKFEHDKQNRAYEEIIQQLREELQQKNDLLQRSFHKLSQCQTEVSNGQTQVSQLDTISIFAYRDLYQKTLQQLEQVKNKLQQLEAQIQTADQYNQSRESFGFRNFSIMENISQIHEVGQFQVNNTKDYTIDQEISIREERIQILQRQNTQLQVEIASISHKIGQIFNAAFQFGGAKLLDHLQHSIGLRQDDDT